MTWSWLWRRIVSMLFVLWLVSFITYGLMELMPGSGAEAVLGPSATPENIERVRQDLNLDEPFLQRYGTWLVRAVQGDLGVTYPDGRVVTVVFRESLPTTLELVLLAQLFAIAAALPTAMAAARREGTRADRTLSAGSFIAITLPQLVLGIILLTVFAVRLRWFPASEYTHLTESVWGNLRSMVLPTVTLALPLAGIYFRVLRNDLVTTLRSDHIFFARGMGLSSRQVLWRRALKPSSMTLVSVLGLNIAALLGGVVIAEQIYGLPGLGRLLVGGVLTRQVTLVQGAVMFVALVYLVANLLVDIALMALDPRVRLENAAT